MDKLFAEITTDGERRLIGKFKNVVASVLIPIVILKDEIYIILEKRALKIPQGGEISFPGGKFEERDITSENTAIRECIEELGISRNKISVYGKFGTLINHNGVVIDVYIGKINIQNLSDLEYNKDEVEKVMLVPLKFFANNSPRVEKIAIKNIPLFSTEEMKLPERYYGEWNGRDKVMYFYSFEGETIWGMTADIIYDFVSILKNKLYGGNSYDIK